MVGRFANFSGQEVIKILQKQFGFVFVSKGSHIKLRKLKIKTVTVIVPNHQELGRYSAQHHASGGS